MKKVIVVLIVLSLSVFNLTGCAARYGVHDPKDKQALRTLAGGLAGGLVFWNAGGIILGAFITDIVYLVTVSYDDKTLESGEAAAKRYNDKYRVDQKIEEDKKSVRKTEEDKKVGLFIEDSSLPNLNVKTGATIEANVQYMVLAQDEKEQVNVTETRTLLAANKKVELAKREIVRTPGTHISTIKFTMPDDLQKGYCILLTTISDGKQTKTAKSVMNVI